MKYLKYPFLVCYRRTVQGSVGQNEPAGPSGSHGDEGAQPGCHRSAAQSRGGPPLLLHVVL